MNRHPVIGGNKILDLDFSRKTPEKGWKLRGNARLTGGGLSVLNDNIRKPDGLLLRGIPELTPENAFQIMADVVLDSRYKRSNVPAMIYDSKYVAKPGKNSPYHKGFMFYLMRMPEKVKCGEAFEIQFRILDGNGHPVKAILPVEIQLISSGGMMLPGSGFYAAENGVLTIREVMASNLSAGKIQVIGTCLASGKKSCMTVYTDHK